MQKSYYISSRVDNNYFCITPYNHDTTIKYHDWGHFTDLSYSTDKINWTKIEIPTQGIHPFWSITTSVPIYFKGKNSTFKEAIGTPNHLAWFEFSDYVDLSGKLNSICAGVPNPPFTIKCPDFRYLFGVSDSDYSWATNTRDKIKTANNLILDFDDNSGTLYRSMFAGCTSLINIPQIYFPNCDSVAYCTNMFVNCTSLTDLNSLTLDSTNKIVYEGMFKGCTSLNEVPTITGSYISQNYQFLNMFENCTSLTSIPYDLLPATTLSLGCYYEMFKGCTSLVNACYLPATTLTVSCYRGMFQNCDSLVELPALYATELPDYCYNQMFARKMTNNKYSYIARYTNVSGDYPAYRIPYTGTITQSYANSIQMIGLTDTSSALNNLDINTQYYLYTHKNDGDYNNITIIGIQN